MVGIELGADASADIDLDDYLVFENNPEQSLSFFREMIFRHATALNDSGRPLARDLDDFIQHTFTQERALKELVRASEGVPRDAIHILQKAVTNAGDQKISIPTIFVPLPSRSKSNRAAKIVGQHWRRTSRSATNRRSRRYTDMGPDRRVEQHTGDPPTLLRGFHQTGLLPH